MTMSMEQKQTRRHTEQSCGCQGGVRVGKGSNGSLGTANVNQYIQDA